MKDTIPVALMTVIALVMILDFFIGDNAALAWIGDTAVVTRSWGIVISAFAMGLGAINLLRRHSRSVLKRDENAFYSFLLILSPASSTMYASIAFYIVTAAYRSFSARNLEGWLLLITAVIVMLGKAPIGSVISDFFPVASTWIESVPNTAGMRAIMMGAALGVISSAVKMFLGLDKSYLGQR